VQEVFERAIRSLPGFEYTGAPFSAYLTRIARNIVHDRWRSENRRNHVRAEQLGGEVPEVQTPEESAVSTSEREVLRTALGALSHSHRLVLYLRVIKGLSARETAQRMGRRDAAVRQLQRRALEALRIEMERIEKH
jgi:RNA polymerase sigma-70 factor (ECF subfamily)